MLNKRIIDWASRLSAAAWHLKSGYRIMFILLLIGGAAAAQPRPNILWITIEDTSPQFIGCYGNEDASTPVIDQLAAEGVRFTNAFSTGTVCSPSRSTLITGVPTYLMGTGNHRSQYPIPDFIKGFPYYLQQEGYYVTNNSKTDYNVRDEKAFIQEAWDESSNQAGWWNREPGQPFFSVFNFNDSHQSRTMTFSYEEYEEEVLAHLPEELRIGENEFEMPPFYQDTPAMRRQFARVYNSIKLTDIKIGELLDRLEADQLRDSTIIFFFADHGEGIPRGKTNGINLGYRVPMVVWVPEMYRDQSPWETGFVSDELINFADLPPTVLSLAGGQIPDHMTGRAVLGEQRSPAEELLFLSADRSDNGIDLVRSVTDGRYVYSRNYLPYMPEARFIRYMEIGAIKQEMRQDLAKGQLNELQRRLFEPRSAESLYDIENDLWETDNLIGGESASPILPSMRSALEENILQSRDVLFLPEYELAQISDSIPPYEFRQDSRQYPLDDIYAAASLSGKRGAEIAQQQVALLSSANDVVRYWAMAGLRSQPEDHLEPHRGAIIDAMADAYPPVAITASAIAYDTFGSEQAVENLKRYCQNENVHLALLTINYLLYVENPDPFVETITQVKEREDLPYEVSAASKDFLGSLGLLPNDFAHR